MNCDNALLNFSQNLRHLRLVHNLTQKEMAQILGISVSKLAKIEKGDQRTRIQCQILCQVCDHFCISTDEMLFENWPEALKGRL